MKILYILFTFTYFMNATQARQNKSFVIDDGKKHSHNSRWLNSGFTDEKNVKEVFNLLLKSKTARKVIAKAKEKASMIGQTLYDVVEVGEGSLLDTTLIRRFSPDTPNEIAYETKSKIFLNKDLKFVDAALDLVHELTHYVYREPFNPYTKNFSLAEFIKSTVEGKGGEVDAYLVECKVFFELFPQIDQFKSSCSKIIDQKTGKISRKMAIQGFYKVGSHKRSFKKKLKRYNSIDMHFPLLSGTEALFVSSAYGLPYPIAALEEYVSIMNKACQNDEKRLVIMQRNIGRNIASTESFQRQHLYTKLKKSFDSRCHNFYSLRQ